MSEVILKADATFGLKAKAGDRVQRGDEIGIAARTGEALICQVSGIVKEISFEAEGHDFVIVLKSD